MCEKSFHHIVVGDIATNCWIYPLSETSCAVIDPGGEGGRIIAMLDSLNLVPEYILLTHGHFDHIGAVPALFEEYRKRLLRRRRRRLPQGRENCQIAIHAADAEYMGPNSLPVHCRSFSAAAGQPESLVAVYIKRLWDEMPPPDRTLTEGDTVGPFTVLHLPGHSPGSIAFWDKEKQVLFSGDTLFCGDYGRTDLPGGSETQLLAGLKRLFAMDGGIRVYPGHGPSTSIEKESKNN